MQATRYQVTDVDLSLTDSNPYNIEDGAVGVEFTPGSKPTYNSELDALIGTATLEIELYRHDGSGRPTPETSQDPDAKLGEISATFRLIVPGDEEELESIASTWRDEGYSELGEETRFQLESGIGTEIMNPLSDLVDNSFRGLLPHTRFTPSDPE